MDRWDLFVEIAPKQAKGMSEIPNRLRNLLGVPLKHHNGKFKVSEGTHTIPQPLALAIEELLLERIQLGEEVSFDYAWEVVQQAVTEWNSQLEALTNAVRESLGPQFLRHHDQDLPEDPSKEALLAVEDAANQDLNDILSMIFYQ